MKGVKKKTKGVNNYIENRMFFQSKRESMTLENLHLFKARLKKLLKKTTLQKERDDIEDLIDDVDVEISTPRKAIYDANAEILPTSWIFKTCDFDIKIDNFHEGNLLHKVEREIIRLCLIQFQGNKSATARALGVTYVTVGNRMRHYNFNSEGKHES